MHKSVVIVQNSAVPCLCHSFEVERGCAVNGRAAVDERTEELVLGLSCAGTDQGAVAGGGDGGRVGEEKGRNGTAGEVELEFGGIKISLERESKY